MSYLLVWNKEELIKYNNNMKRIITTMAIAAGMMASVMMFSSFTTPKQSSLSIEMNANNWKLFREKVPYCDAGKDVCAGYGYVWVNTETYQVAISLSINPSSVKYDLSEYSGKEGYNMRFWHESNKTYYYVNIYIPKSAFE